MLIGFLKNSKFDFMGIRKICFAFSGFVLIASVIAFLINGLNYGVDFEGGYSFELRSVDQTPINTDIIREILAKNSMESGIVQSIGDNAASFKISHSCPEEIIQSIKKEISEKCENVEFAKFELIGPKISAELVLNGIFATLCAMLAIFIYVWIRYKWQFGLCAVIALLHDCFFVFALFSIFRIEFNETAIVAFLITIVYSINDTVVIFDRIQDNLKIYRLMELKDLINLSLNSTLSRTVLTSCATLLSLLVLYIFGGPVIQEFSFPIIIGIIAGTYSSIFTAAPMLTWFPSDGLISEDNKAAGK